MAKVTRPVVKDVSAKDLRLITEGFAALVVKAQFAMNGGASAAMLAFIGTGVADEYLRSAVFALLSFATGVLLAAMVSALSFFAAKRFYEAKQHANDWPRTEKEHRRGKLIYWVSCGCVWLSAGVFAVGVIILCYSILTVEPVTAEFKSISGLT